MIDVKIIRKPKNEGTTSALKTGGIAYGEMAVKEAAHAAKADYADEAGHALSAKTLDSNSDVFDKFLRKDINDTAQGLITFLQGIQFGTGDNAVCLRWDSANQAVCVARANGDAANFYALGNISAYGANGISSGGGGGLSVNVVAYNDALNLTSEDLSKVASAYSIAKLKQLIDHGSGGTFSSIVTTGSGNAITSVVASGSEIVVTKGKTFLTEHQSLLNYVTLNTAQTITGAKTFSENITLANDKNILFGTGYIRFGTGTNAVYLKYDSANKALYVEGASGGNANFYAKGNVSAYGIGSASSAVLTVQWFNTMMPST